MVGAKTERLLYNIHCARSLVTSPGNDSKLSVCKLNHLEVFGSSGVIFVWFILGYSISFPNLDTPLMHAMLIWWDA